jgi:hypothetical protein
MSLTTRLAIAFLLLGLPLLPVTGAPGAPSCSSSWRVVPTPPVPGRYQTLYDVTMRSLSDAWTVGNHVSGFPRTLAERWDGSSWHVVSTPNTTKQSNFLYGVSASSRSDVWAVGSDLAPDPRGGASRQSQAMHWNGSSWRIVRTPYIQYSSLQAVADVSPADVWAVANAGHGRVEYWNGTRWRIVQAAKLDAGYTFWDTTFLSPNEGWVVGNRSLGPNAGSAPLAEHWDGTSWKLTPAPGHGSLARLEGVSARASDDVWAVGSIRDRIRTPFRTNILHWDGTSWTAIPSPNVGTHDNVLLGVRAVAANDAWAVGWWTSSGYDKNTHLLVLHWNGRAWAVAKTPTFTGNSILYDLAGNPRELWAVGSTWSNGVHHTLAMRVCPG